MLTLGENRPDIVIDTIQLKNGKEWYVITHENTAIDSSVRDCYRKLLHGYIELFISNNASDDDFISGLADVIGAKKVNYFFWGYEIMGIVFFEKNARKNLHALGTLEKSNSQSLKIKDEKENVKLMFGGNNEGDNNDTDSSSGITHDTATINSLKEKFKEHAMNIFSDKKNSIGIWVAVAVLAVIIYLILNQLFTNNLN